MAVTGTARIPALPPNALSVISTHLQTQHGAQHAGAWRVRWRPHRPVRGAPTDESARQRRVMYEITDSAHPQHVFLLFEDSASPTRAELQAVPQQSGEHSRWHSHVVSAEFHTLLRHANLPGPLGSPAGTPGPGAWVQRGAQILFDGMSFRIRLGRRTLDAKNEQPECLLNIGNVVIGADRIVGGIVEIQYLPLTRLPPDSTLLGSLLVALLPADVVPLLVPVPALQTLLFPSIAPRTMMTREQLAEIVPASTCAWRQASAPDPGLAGFPAWDDASGDDTGWTGVEPRRRLAFVQLSMLRSEGLA